MKVLVTGGSGFIGSHVVPLLVQAGHEVHLAGLGPAVPAGLGAGVSLQGTQKGIQFHEVNVLTCDCRDLLERIRPSHMIHLAWHVPPGAFWSAQGNIDWLVASLALLKAFAAAGGRRWVGAGTCAEYDWSRGGVFRETDPTVPGTLYGACKASLQSIAMRMAEDLGLEAAWGRIFFPYGPREPAGRFIPSLIRSLLAGEPAACTAGRQLRDYVFVEDVAAAIVCIMESGVAGPINIGSGAPAEIRDIAARIGRITGSPGLIRTGELPDRPGEPREITADVSRLKQLGWMPRHSLDEGLRQTVTWWRGKG